MSNIAKMSAKKKKAEKDLYAQSILEEALFAVKVLYGAAKIKDFPHYKSYVKTVKAESKYVRGIVLLVGCGPLPLTAICLDNLNKSDIHRIRMMDKDWQSVEIANNVCPIRGKIHNVYVRDATSPDVYGGYNTIILTLEAGNSLKNKRDIINNIHSQMNSDSTLIVRSSNTSDYVNTSKVISSGMFNIVDKISVFDGLSTSYILQKA